MKKILLIFILLPTIFPLSNCLGQNNSDIRRTYHWYFGNRAGLDFSSGSPQPIMNSALTAEEGCASISDTCGDMLFYTDGDTVWNKENNVMFNGTGLMGCWSSTQSALIVPQPGNDSIYYIFTTDCGENAMLLGLRYSIVNINLNGGLGSVIQKNVLLYAPSMEKLAATYHANGTDIWILSNNSYPSGPPPDTTFQYLAYLLTSTGINATPVISSSKVDPHKWMDGYLRFSNKGNKVANSWHAASCYLCDTLEILDFDNSTGILSNPFTLSSDTAHVQYGLAFSPDDSKLYHSILNEFFYPRVYFKIFQYDLSSNNPVIIAASKTVIQLSDSSTHLVPSYYALQTGPDGKIYVAKINNEGGNWYPDSIDVITQPNLAGLACNYVENGIAIGGGSQMGLPNFVDSYFRSSWMPVCNVSIEENSFNIQISVYPNPFSEYTTVDIKVDELLKDRKLNYSLFDLMGREARSSRNQAVQSFRISQGNLNSGVYILKIQIGNYNYFNKLIIN